MRTLGGAARRAIGGLEIAVTLSETRAQNVDRREEFL